MNPATCDSVSSQLIRVYEKIISNADPRIVAVDLCKSEKSLF